MKTSMNTEPWGLGYYAEGARGSTGPVGSERAYLDSIRDTVAKKLQKSFAEHALHATNTRVVDTETDTQEILNP